MEPRLSLLQGRISTADDNCISILDHTACWTEIYAKPKGDDVAQKAVADKYGMSSNTIDEIKVHGLDPEQVSG